MTTEVYWFLELLKSKTLEMIHSWQNRDGYPEWLQPLARSDIIIWEYTIIKI